MKKYTTDNGSRCSGYGVYPDNRKCKGCSDCEGKYLKRNITNAEIHKQFNRTHTLMSLTNLKGINMITQKNYFTEVNKIGVENLPDTFKKSHELVNKVTKSGTSWETANANESIKRMIDLYFSKLSQFENKQAPVPAAARPASHPKKIKKEVTAVQPPSPPSHPSEKTKKVRQTTKPKQTKQNNAVLVERLDDEISLIKRFINFHDKQRTRDQVYSLLKAIQKAILERRVNKNSAHGKEVMQIQDSLLGALKHDVKIFDIKIEKKQLEHYTEIVTGVAPMDSIRLVKRYVGLQNKTGIIDKAVNLRDAVQKWFDANNLKNDKYYKYLAAASNNLNDYIQQVQVLKNKTAVLKTFTEAELNGLGLAGKSKKANLGFAVPFLAATAGSLIEAFTNHHLTKPKKQLSGIEPEVMSVSDAKNEVFKEIGLTGEFLQLIGRACGPTSIFIYGNGGSGKSGLALKLADKLNQLNHSVLYAAGEQYGTPTFTELLKKVNISGGDNFKIVKSLSTLPIANFDVIVIDSKESAGINKSADFKQLRDAYPDKIWIITSQGNKSGSYAGDGKWQNECEVFIYCEHGKATTIGEKNRWGGSAEIKLF